MERCDGGRNIFHAAVSMCQPFSNKETYQPPFPTNFGSATKDSVDGTSISSPTPISHRSINLRDMMRRVAAASL